MEERINNQEEHNNKKKKSIVHSEAFPGILLVIATVLALILANTPLDKYYEYILKDIGFGEFNLHVLINDFLMAIFFLVVGCEIKREAVFGKLSNIKAASFPIIAAIGGMVAPAIIFTLFNYNSGFEIGAGIPLSTDIAFAIGIFTILSKRLNPSLKVFLLTLAVVDDLLSIVIIGIFYSSKFNITAIIAAIVLIVILFLIKTLNKKNRLWPYMIVGFCLWLATYFSGIHATIAGVILALSLPLTKDGNKSNDLSLRVQHGLEPLTNYFILPLFAFANTGVNLSGSINLFKEYPLMTGIVLGLVIGKPIGIMTFTYIASLFGITKKPNNASWFDVFAVSVLAGIGFTMSIFVSELAFKGSLEELNASKVSILSASVISIIFAFIVSLFNKKKVK
ncbi:Na+/H+ antiporter NhaA [Clostridium sp. NSJ-49]|uniref:Na+/H+ antiporter NhaA n=1 Tax=Clostridium TaxID=1485 RepID=UPI00164A90D4|nr:MULTISPECIES: Na+/H+ antiporter NhaA [unclassified Clostridium]MBC5626961.1 Na+/H+ antiporter NhaA [Clostridium sp. NSJ-49]MCD2500666.1 Na+/H+ antiporter NhaA [Clostridium sp. NSJ-145]